MFLATPTSPAALRLPHPHQDPSATKQMVFDLFVSLLGHPISQRGCPGVNDTDEGCPMPAYSDALRAKPLPECPARRGRALPGSHLPSCGFGLLPKPTSSPGLKTRSPSQLSQDPAEGWPGPGVTMHLKLPQLKAVCPPPFLHSSTRPAQPRERPLRLW